jgi:protein-L-isoaspartate(D-aspartate) O-methyltransferase
MVDTQIRSRGVEDERVLAALRTVPRHEFLPESLRYRSYEDSALPLGPGQTISQPYIVGVMTELATLRAASRVLEVGTGSGYQAAVLAELAEDVFTMEIDQHLAGAAAATLRRLGYRRVRCREGNGWEGWPEEAPFDAILVTACSPTMPPALSEQLAKKGRLVIPLGKPGGRQKLVVFREHDGRLRRTDSISVRFVPLVK